MDEFDGDGNVTTADAGLLIQALTNRMAYDATYPLLDADALGDVDMNGVFDLGDLSAFSVLLGGPATALLGRAPNNGPAVAPSVPEPGAILLVLCGLPLLLARRRRGRRR